MLLSKKYINIYTQYLQSLQITQILKYFINNDSILVDATAGMGGDSNNFCKNFKFVYCLEENYECIKYLEYNLQYFENKEIFNINCIEGLKLINYNAVYFDPPWGGNNYKYKNNLDLFLHYNNKQINILDFINSLYFYSEFIFMKIPINFNNNKLNQLLWKYIIFPIYKFTNNFNKISFNLIVFYK